MTPATPTPTPAASATLLRCYLKSVSLEMPGAHDLLLSAADAGQRSVRVDLNLSSSTLDEAVREVCVRSTLTVSVPAAAGAASQAPVTLMLLETEQAGVFKLDGVAPEDMAQALYVVCASTVYSYLRPNVSDALSRTTLPPYFLPDVNFAEMLAQSRAAGAVPK